MDDGIKKNRLIKAASVYVGLVLAVVMSARMGVFPGVGEEFAGESLFSHPYRASVGISGLLLAVYLGVLSGFAGQFLESWWKGFVMLVLGGGVALVLSEIAPMILYPGDKYPVAFQWLVGLSPVALLTWLGATVGRRFLTFR